MIAIIIISSIVTPPFIVMMIYFNIVDQKDQYGFTIQTKEDAQKETLPKILKHPVAICWYIWIALLILFVAIYIK